MTTATRIHEPQTTAAIWKIDPSHTEAGFSVRHLMIANVRGRFADVKGEVLLNEAQMERSKVAVEIGAASIDTREPRRDEHLRSPDFFDAAKYPLLTFESDRVQQLSDGRLRITGRLTIRDVTRPVVLEVLTEGRGKDPWGSERVAFSATTSIDRREFGLTWNQALETGGVLVGNEVRISLEVEAVREAGTA